MSVALPISLYPEGARVKIVSKSGDSIREFLINPVLTADQVWAKNLSHRFFLGAAISMVILAISTVGMGVTDQPRHLKTKSFAHQFFIRLALLGGCGFALSFIGCAYASYHFNKV